MAKQQQQQKNLKPKYQKHKVESNLLIKDNES